MKRTLFFCSLFLVAMLPNNILLGQDAITLNNLWGAGMYHAKTVSGFSFLKDGKHYSRVEGGKIMAYNIENGQATHTIFDAKETSTLKSVEDFEYQFSSDEQYILLQTEVEPIYRHSFRARAFVWNVQTKELKPVFENGKVRCATFSPNGSKVAFEYENDLYIKNINTNEITRLTNDGKYNHIINGVADWVYEEEFSFTRAFEWSPDGEKLAFIRFDESEVPLFAMERFTDALYPAVETFKYPKVGEKNAMVSVHIYDHATKKIAKAKIEEEKDFYVPRIKWTQNANMLCITQLNRHQNDLKLLLANAQTGDTKLLFREQNKYYIDVHDNLTFLNDGKHFLWTSESDGFNHLYLYDLNGKKVRQLTEGKWEVTAFYGLDETAQTAFYQSTEQSPMERHLYSINLKGSKKKCLTERKGWNDAQFSSTHAYFVLSHSDANTPPSYTVFSTKKLQEIRTIEDNALLKTQQKKCDVQPVEFFTFKTEDGTTLNAWMIKPHKFDASKKYPVLMYEYGGPGSQEATHQWKHANYWWFQMLAQKGYLVACIDNRGTGGRGEAFKKMTYLQLGKYETIDQIAGAKHLATMPYVDASRIGIFGWSYGGFLSSLCILKGNDVFKAAIAVAPVTSWRWYDTVYTERFMRTEKENPEGYKENSPVYFANKLKGNYLLIHGMADDNVHFQHTAEMANALINNNKQFDTYFYPNKNHSIRGGFARLHLYTKMTDFIVSKL